MKIRFYRGAVIFFAHKTRHWEILLFRRAISPYKGYWSVLGGKSKSNEEFRETACREASEEAFEGVRLEDYLKKYLSSDFDMSKVPEEIYSSWFFYKWRNYLVKLAEKPPMDLFKLNYENDSARWFSVMDLPSMVFPGVSRSIKKFGLL